MGGGRLLMSEQSLGDLGRRLFRVLGELLTDRWCRLAKLDCLVGDHLEV